MNIMKFITQNSSHFTLHIGYKEKYIEETNNFPDRLKYGMEFMILGM